MTRLALDGGADMGSDVASRDSGQMMYLCLLIHRYRCLGGRHTAPVVSLFLVPRRIFIPHGIYQYQSPLSIDFPRAAFGASY